MAYLTLEHRKRWALRLMKQACIHGMYNSDTTPPQRIIEMARCIHTSTSAHGLAKFVAWVYMDVTNFFIEHLGKCFSDMWSSYVTQHLIRRLRIDFKQLHSLSDKEILSYMFFCARNNLRGFIRQTVHYTEYNTTWELIHKKWEMYFESTVQPNIPAEWLIACEDWEH